MGSCSPCPFDTPPPYPYQNAECPLPDPWSRVTFQASHHQVVSLSLDWGSLCADSTIALVLRQGGRCAIYYPYKPAPFFLSLPFKRAFLFDWTRKGTLRGELTSPPLYCPINACPVKDWVGSPEPPSMRTFNPSGKCKVALNTIKGQISMYSLPSPSPIMYGTVCGCRVLVWISFNLPLWRVGWKWWWWGGVPRETFEPSHQGSQFPSTQRHRHRRAEIMPTPPSSFLKLYFLPAGTRLGTVINKVNYANN